MPSSAALLEQLLHKKICFFGELFLDVDFSLRHRHDRFADRSKLRFYQVPEAARDLARYDKEGNYRPLKTAPNLSSGWLLQLKNSEEMALALEFFYPAALSLYEASLRGVLETTVLRETLDRQSGMYRITQQLSNDEAQELLGKMCCSERGCLRKILWTIDVDQKINTLPFEKLNPEAPVQEIPLLCREACNLFVGAARSIVKKKLLSKKEGE